MGGVRLRDLRYTAVPRGEAGGATAAAAAAGGSGEPEGPQARTPSREDGGAAAAGPPRLADLLPLERVDDLELHSNALGFLPQLCGPAAAAALTALRALALHSYHGELEDAIEWWEQEEQQQQQEQGQQQQAQQQEQEQQQEQQLERRRAPWSRAPWLARLTALVVHGYPDTAELFAATLAPGALAALVELEVDVSDGHLAPADVAALLAACNPAALRALTLRGVPFSVLGRALEALPAIGAALAELTLRDTGEEFAPFSDDGTAAEYAALAAAPLAPLECLGLGHQGGAWLFRDAARLAALLAAPWAARVRRLEIVGDCEGGLQFRAAELKSLAALSALRRMESLTLHCRGLDPAALERAAAEGWADAWAPRLLEFKLTEPGAGARLRRALLKLPFARIQGLWVDGQMVDWDEASEFKAECMRAWPTLQEVTLW